MTAKNTSILALIPARGGSVRLPRKNILPFAGKPLIAWSIEAALGAGKITKVVVSTDDDEISSVSKKYGAEVPFQRPAELATNTSTTTDVLIHAIEYFKSINESFDYVIVLQPTSPLRTSTHINEAIDLLNKKEADAIVSVCELAHPIEWCNFIPENLSLENFLDEKVKNKRSQDFVPVYRPNGSIFILDVEKFLNCKKLYFDKNIYAYNMRERTSIDIDTIEDLLMAECLKEKVIQMELDKSNVAC